jgi:hypothetical protein
MRRYSEADKADVKGRMSRPHRQSLARISVETGIQVAPSARNDGASPAQPLSPPGGMMEQINTSLQLRHHV